MTVNNIPTKLKGFDFWRTALKSARYVVAPMVDQSELTWRMLSRKYNAELCYTPMFHARMFGDPNNTTYKNEAWHTIPEDRPLIAQFCSNNPDELLRAAKLVETECDAVDINLGCPQHIAKRGHYGSYLQDEWELIEKMVRILDENLAIPVTCKIRIFPDVEKTIRYAKMLENAGCQLLTVHGRLREQKGHNTGLADWEQIKLVKEAVKIPVFANGNILYHEDVERCMEKTGVEGVMSAEANLYNPALFSGKEVPLWVLGEEYIELCKKYEYSNKNSYIKAHLFKLYKQCLSIHTDIRDQLAKAKGLSEYEQVVKALNDKLKEVAAEHTEAIDYSIKEDGFKKLPYWIAQSYIRPPPGVNESKNKVLVELNKKNAKESGVAQASEVSDTNSKPEATQTLEESKSSEDKEQISTATEKEEDSAQTALNGKRKIDETN